MICLLNWHNISIVLVGPPVLENQGGQSASSSYSFFVTYQYNLSAVTLVGEADRKMLKAAIKNSARSDQVRHRIIPPEVVKTWFERLERLSDEVAEILQEEKADKKV